MENSYKVSCNVAMAKDTTRHNDRSLYKGKYKNEFEEQSHPDNIHWDCYNCGSSWDAEKRFYDEKFGAMLAQQNENARAASHPERIKTMNEFREVKNNHPRECILQLGDKDHHPTGEEAVRLIVAMRDQAIEDLKACGCDVISADIHMDEATPHVHIRFIGIDDKGHINMAGCLAKHGVKSPLEIAADKAGVEVSRKKGESPIANLTPDDIQKIKAIDPKLFKPNKTGTEVLDVKYNTAINTLSNAVLRADTERVASDLGYDIDTVRTKREHLTVEQFKQQKKQEDLDAALDKSVQNKEALLQTMQEAMTLKPVEVKTEPLMVKNGAFGKKESDTQVVIDKQELGALKTKAALADTKQETINRLSRDNLSMKGREDEVKRRLDRIAERERKMDEHDRERDKQIRELKQRATTAEQNVRSLSDEVEYWKSRARDLAVMLHTAIDHFKNDFASVFVGLKRETDMKTDARWEHDKDEVLGMQDWVAEKEKERDGEER